ncbi:amidase [Candidatus Regiella insecticola]|uniref:Amidase n=1 Tax=Candidatus Regiella insecticola TaxID=138073 RepID=A0A6L2ZT12_9ENTR|nr:amidase [Candidatus Regiella insecticola]
MVQVTAAAALSRAREADAALSRGEIWGSLHGVPFTVKDVIETAGVICAAGLETRANFIPSADAIVVSRMRAAGGILLGKTNCPPGGGGGVTDNPVYGATRNPHDLSRSPGGSSGGEAAAIAACLSPLGIGSDSGGSLRIPADFCGIATIKPTSGRVPNTGVFDHPGGLSDYRTQIGPMARYIKDLDLALRVIAGMDGQDSGVIPMPLQRPEEVSMHGLRVAYYTDDGVIPPCASTVKTVRDCVQVLNDAGATVNCMRPACLSDARKISERYWHMQQSSGAEIQRLFADWDRFRSAMLSFMTNYDVIVCPVDAEAAPLLEMEKEKSRHGMFNYTLPYSLSGWPCVVLPAGASGVNGLPIGVQIIANAWHEHVALAVATQIEAAALPRANNI